MHLEQLRGRFGAKREHSEPESARWDLLGAENQELPELGKLESHIWESSAQLCKENLPGMLTVVIMSQNHKSLISLSVAQQQNT